VPNATNATNASNASALGGFVADAYFRSENVVRVDHALTRNTNGEVTSATALNSGLILTTACNFDSGTNTQTITLRAAVFGSIEAQNVNPRISWQFVHDITSAEHGESGQLTSTDSNLFSRPKPSGGEQGAGTFVYRDDTQTITIPFRYTVDKNANKCAVSGVATRAGA
jgi:hypothetical protein